MLVYGKYECFVMQMLYVCVLCASCGSSQCCILHDLQFDNAARGCKRRPYGRGILQSLSYPLWMTHFYNQQIHISHQLYTSDIKLMHWMLNCSNNVANQYIINVSHDANTPIGYKLGS